MAKIKKPSQKLDKTCVVCGKEIKVILYQDKSYRGGHYFGKIPDSKINQVILK